MHRRMSKEKEARNIELFLWARENWRTGMGHWLTMDAQPRPLAAIDLIHKQPVRWTQKKVVSCDGGGGPLGHPRIFINTDKPQICACTYCGVPYVSSRHR